MEEEKLTKRQKRVAAKEEKKRQQEAKGMRARFKKLAVWLVSGIVIFFLGTKVVNWLRTPQPEIAGEAVEVAEDEWVKGSSEAQVTLIEYSDFQCPACTTYQPIVKRLTEEFTDDLRVVYRHFPLTSIHENAVAAARASEAAGVQGKFWEMHDLLFEKQNEWGNDATPKDKFESYADELGLDKERFWADFESKEIEEEVYADLTSANRLGLTSTPSFLVNGKKITNPQGYEAFSDLIETELRGYTLE